MAPARAGFTQNPANHGEPSQNRHHDAPAGAPDVVHAHDGQASHKEQNARDEDQSRVVTDLFGHFRKMTGVDQHRDANRQESRADQTAIIFVVAMKIPQGLHSDITVRPNILEGDSSTNSFPGRFG